MSEIARGSDMGTPTEADWLGAVETALRGQSPDSLVSQDHGGFTRQPLYTEAKHPTNHDPAGLPGVAPYMRGAAAVNDKFLPWQIAQRVRIGRDGADNAAILTDLAGGVSALLIDAGTAALSVNTLRPLLDGVMLDVAPLALAAGNNISNAEALLALYADADQPANCYVNHDPYLDRLEGAAPPPSLEPLLTLAPSQPGLTVLTANGAGWNAKGASAVQELAWALATLSDHMRQAETDGCVPDAALASSTLTLAAETDFFATLAKIRAARLLFANIAKAVGAAQLPPRIHVETSLRTFSDVDPWVNILRATAAAMGAGIAGVDWLTVAPCSASSAADNTLTRRIARNTQVILQEESHIGHVADAAGGSWYVEQLTRDLAESAWAEFQAIEAAGGFANVLQGQQINDALAAQCHAMQADVNNRRLPLVGVSEFPNLDEAPLPEAAGDTGFRLAAPFEALRRAAQKAKPKVFQACLGDMAAFTPRANFAANLYAAGGLHSLTGDGGTDVDAIADAFKKSNAKVAVICGSDADYDTHAAALTKALMGAGVTHLALAGKPRDIDGIDAYCFAGGEALAFLQDVHARLGLEG